MKVECIDYRQLPSLNPLFPQYLYQYDQVDTLYDCPVHLSLEDLKKRDDSVLKCPPSFNSDKLVDLTLDFNRSLSVTTQSQMYLHVVSRVSRCIAVSALLLSSHVSCRALPF